MYFYIHRLLIQLNPFLLLLLLLLLPLPIILYSSVYGCGRRILRILGTLAHGHVTMSESSHTNITPILPNLFRIGGSGFILLWEYCGGCIWCYLLPIVGLLRMHGLETHSICRCQFGHGLDGREDKRGSVLGSHVDCGILLRILSTLDDGAGGGV